MRTILYFLIFALGSAGAPTWAENLTLKDALSEALSASPQAQQADSRYKHATWEKRGALKGFLPQVSASANYITSQHYLYTDIDFGGAPVSVPQIIPTSNLTLQAQLPLFDGFASTNNYFSKSANEEAQEHLRDWTRFSLKRQVEEEYFQVVAAKLMKAVSDQNIKTLKDHLRDTQLQKKSGISTQYDVLQVEVQVSNAEAELLNAADNIEIAKMNLRETLGRKEVDFDVEGSLPELRAELIDALSFESAVQERKDLKGLELEAESLEKASSASNRFWVPQIGLFGQYQYYNNRNQRFDDWDNYRDAYQFGFSMTWNLFDGMGSLSKSQETAEVSYQAQKSLEGARLKAKSDFEIWKRKYVYNCRVYQAKLSDVKKAEESVRLAKEGRRVGVRTNTDFLDAESELYGAQAGAVKAQLGALQALLHLELAVGKELTQFEGVQ